MQPTPEAQERELEQDGDLRPERFADFVGQRQLVDNLTLAIRAALGRGEPPDHLLLSGPPGLGKTTLARIVANELGSSLVSTSGPALVRPADLIGILMNLRARDALFIDEIHRLPAAVAEYLYTAMEDRRIEMTINEGTNAQVMPLTLQPFVLIGATTREGLLSSPFRARFGLVERLVPYPLADLQLILQRSAGLFGLALDAEAVAALAKRARGTPRVANRLLRRVRDLAQMEQRRRVDLALVEDCMARHGIDAHGLEEMDRRILAYLARNPDRAVGLKTLAAATGESEDTLEDVFEPHLIRLGFLHKTARGRQVTPQGLAAIDKPAAGGLFDA
jgi:Holliday junction DNA helicase RuvB